jgi:hypothetical protein
MATSGWHVVALWVQMRLSLLAAPGCHPDTSSNPMATSCLTSRWVGGRGSWGPGLSGLGLTISCILLFYQAMPPEARAVISFTRWRVPDEGDAP